MKTNLYIVYFGSNSYRITNPLPTWFRRSPDDVPECSDCGDVLTFVFVPRVNPETGGFAGSYQTPVAIRCSCFLVDPNSIGLTHHKKLSREPITIIPVSGNDYEEGKAGFTALLAT